MNCAECGKPLPMDARFCSACGEPVAATTAEAGGGAQPALVRPSPHLRSVSRRRASHTPTSDEPQRAPPASPLVPAAMVITGCALAVGIIWAKWQEDAAFAEAGARRVATAASPVPPASQPAGATGFPTRRALRGLYGNYDPAVDGAVWKVSGAPPRWRHWNGKTITVRPLLSRSDDADTRHVLVTSSVEVDDGTGIRQGAGCRQCKTLLGAAVFERRANEWQLVSEHRFLTVAESGGEPPQVSAVFRDDGAVELRLRHTDRFAPSERETMATFVLDRGTATSPEQVAMETAETGGAAVSEAAAPPAAPRRKAASRAQPAAETPFPSSVSGP